MPEALRLFIICEGMNWAHLPEDGGIYSQHPRLFDDWLVIWAAKGEHDEQERVEKEREAKNKKARR